jgi:hypothetical protein
MAAITDYATLSAAINTWDERTHDTDELIGLAESEFRIYFGPNYAKETTATLTFAAGVAALPTGFIRPISLTHETYGDIPFRDIGTVNAVNATGTTGSSPAIVAISGSSVYSAPLYTGDATFVYDGTLTGLSGSNTTNWLITNAPQAYLSMCLSMAKAKFEDFQGASVLKQQALQTLSDLGMQSTVGAYGRSGMTMRGATP